MDNLELHNEVMFYKSIVERLYSEVQSLQGDIKALRKELSVYSESAKDCLHNWIWMEKYHKKLLPQDVNIIHYAGIGEHTKPWNAPDEWHNQKWMDVWRAVEQDKYIDGLVEEACKSQWKNFRSDSHKY